MAIQRETVGCGPGAICGSVVLKVATYVHRIGREADQPARAETVAQVLIPFVTDGTGAYGGGLTGRLSRNCGVAPEAILAERRRYLDISICTFVDHENCADQRVLGLSAIGWWAKARIAPRSGPYVWQRVDLRISVSLLVANQSSRWGRRSVDAVFPASLPEHYISTEKRQVDARVARGFHVGPLGS